MSIKRYEPNGRYSKVVENNGILYLSGLVCKNPDGDIKQQTAEVLERIEETLSKYGSDKEHILTMTLYLADMSLFGEMNSVYDAWVSKANRPTRACVQAKLAGEEFLLEIVCTAVVK